MCVPAPSTPVVPVDGAGAGAGVEESFEQANKKSAKENGRIARS